MQAATPQLPGLGDVQQQVIVQPCQSLQTKNEQCSQNSSACSSKGDLNTSRNAPAISDPELDAFHRDHEAALNRFAHVDNLGDLGNKQCCENVDEKFFDSSDYRCCCRLFHAKIGTFILCTWLMHEVILAAMFLMSLDEFKRSPPSPNLIVILTCRALQLAAGGFLYLGLWRYKRNWLLPFLVAQYTAGIFADISTLLLALSYLEERGSRLPFGEGQKLLNVLIPLVLYAALMVWLAWVVFRCYQFIGARVEHDEKRRKERERQKQVEIELKQRFGIDVDDEYDELGDLDSDGENANAVDEESRSPSPQASLRQSALRRVSSQQAAPVVAPSAERPHFHVVNRTDRVVRQWHHSGSLQQLPQPLVKKPSNARRLMSLSSAMPLRRLAHENSEPTLALLAQRMGRRS